MLAPGNMTARKLMGDIITDFTRVVVRDLCKQILEKEMIFGLDDWMTFIQPPHKQPDPGYGAFAVSAGQHRRRPAFTYGPFINRPARAEHNTQSRQRLARKITRQHRK